MNKERPIESDGGVPYHPPRNIRRPSNISLSAGVRLVSSLPNIPPLADTASAKELLDFLDIIGLHIDHYGRNLINDPNWEKLVHTKYNELLDFLSAAQSCAISLNHFGLKARCTDLISRLEEFKLRLSLQCDSVSSLSSSSSSIPSNQSVGDSDLLSRVISLEKSSTLMNNILENFSSLASRVAVLEKFDYQSLHQRVEALEASLQSKDSFVQLQNLEARTVTLEASHVQAEDSVDEVRSIALQCQGYN